MDYIRTFEVELDRLIYYAGEVLTGNVYLEVEENMRMQNVKVFLRGKAHTEWKITRAGERRTVKQDEQYIDERILLWGKDDNDSHQGIPIVTRGRHCYPFSFQLPDAVLPCSFESKFGTIRYYVRVHLNIPYASCPQCIRYFTIIGPHIDCMDERFLVPVSSTAKKNTCSLCCGKGPMVLQATLERTGFVCGEQIKLKVEVQNGSDSEVWVLCKLIQYVEFFINKGVLGLSKEVRHTVLETESDKVPAHETSVLDELVERLVIPIMPPTMIDVCGLVQVYYTLKLYLETSKGKGDTAEISFPVTIATVPYKVSSMPDIQYESAAPNVEGGMYISPEFQLGQVYMGDEVDPETDNTILYHPVYVCVTGEQVSAKPAAHLLQVPTRQMARSRDNLVSSKEGPQVQETVASSTYNAQQQAVTLQISNEKKIASCKPEDKFLQEITAKIASRHAKGLNGEDKATFGQGHGDDSSAHHSDVDAQVEMLREQRKSKDSVHKALVNELRRHLSEGEEGTEIEKVPPSLKKPTVFKKGPAAPPEVSGDSNKFATTNSGKTVVQATEPGMNSKIRGKSSEVSPTKSESSQLSALQAFSDIHGQERADQTVISGEQEEDFEFSEHSSLLPPLSDSFHLDMDARMTASYQDQSSISELSMQQSTEFLPPPEEGDISYSQSSHLLRQSTELKDNSDLHGSSVSVARTGKSVRVFSSPHRIVDNITPMAIAATVTCAAPAAADPCFMGKMGFPRVAPKPTHKDRHSFSNVPSGQTSSQSSALTVDIVGRPKSDIVDKSLLYQQQDESSA